MTRCGQVRVLGISEIVTPEQKLMPKRHQCCILRAPTGLTVMEISRTTRRALTPLTREAFEELKNSELVPAEDLTGLKLLREKAGNERNLRELYRDRAPFELIQNADDAGATSAAFVICSDGLAFGHNGDWFTVENFRSLADGWSNKKPGECIGHKGLGFRSVLDLSPSPVIARLSNKEAEQFGVKFSWKNNDAFVQRVLKKAPGLRTDHYDAWTRYGQSACPIMAIPSGIRIDSLGGGTSAANRLRGLGYTTLFWLPAADPDLPGSTAAELGVNPVTSTVGKERLLTFLGQEVSVVLPFLRKVKSISVLEANTQLASVSLAEKEVNVRGSQWTRISTLTSTGTSHPGCREFFQVGTRCAIPPAVKRDPQTPVAARYLHDIAITLAVELVNDQPASLRDAPFYVYFPTEDPTGAGFIVHADFHVEPHRKHLMSGAFNDWIMKEAARLAAGTFLTEIIRRFAAKEAFEALAPVSESMTTNFLEAFARELKLRTTPFVPTLHGTKERDRAVLAPRESQASYFETQLADSVTALHGKTWLVSAAVDSTRSRSFLRLANVKILSHDSLVELVEHAGTSKVRNVEWWLGAYRQFVTDPLVSTYTRDFFVGRNLVPGEKGVLAVPSSGDAQLCLPPARARNTHVPALFSSIFAFVEEVLAAQLDDPEDEMAAWVRDRFGICRFEASDFIPRAVRTVVGEMFSGELRVTKSELVELWRFIRTLSSTSRMQTADALWMAIGRLPCCRSLGHTRPKSWNQHHSFPRSCCTGQTTTFPAKPGYKDWRFHVSIQNC